MGKPTGFKEINRETPSRRAVRLRLLDWDEVYNSLPDDKLRKQGARCMDCGVPFCKAQRVSARQHHSRMERPGLSQSLARCAGHAEQDQQLSGIHRPRLPCAVRGSVRAGDQ